VLVAKDVEKAISDRAEWRANERRWSREGKLPQPGWRKSWVVHIKPVGSGEAALKYLAPYVFRAAVSNSRIAALDQGRITYRYRRSDNRFLLRALPRGFVRVRSYGFLSCRRRDDLARVRELLQREQFKMQRLRSTAVGAGRRYGANFAHARESA